MKKPNVFSYISLGCLLAASGLNLVIYDMSLLYSFLFFVIPLLLGVYGVLFSSRAFVLASGGSLLLVSLRPDGGWGWPVFAFLTGLLVFLESAEASMRYPRMDDTSRRNYVMKSSAVVGGSILFTAGVFLLSPAVVKTLDEAASSAAVLSTPTFPLMMGIAMLAAIALVGYAVRR